jgi:class 3 adenylate cyclase
MSSLIAFLRGDKAESRATIEALATYGVAESTRQSLASYLDAAEDRALYRFNPAYLAEQLKLTRRQGLDLLAAALQAGIVDLNWEVQCPGCGYRAHAFDGLRSAHSDFTCGMCKMAFSGHLDDEIHITFTASQRIRALKNVAEASDEAWRGEIDARLKPVTSHELLTLQVFRNLFVSEPLPVGESFQVKWMALMFTDLGGSTAIYARKGDPRAYSLVREHFNLIFGAVEDAGGAVVKTIGDAVMAVFQSGAIAVQAALESQRRIEQFNRERSLGDDERLRLKVGLHAGPTLAVTLNDRLDYFGTVVNAAARVQGLARHGETVITREILDASGVHELLPADLLRETLVLRGLDELPFEVVRLNA